MDPPRARDEGDVVAAIAFPPRFIHNLDARARHLASRLETGLEEDRFLRAEVVPGADDVAAVRVGGGIEVAQEGEHFGRVPAAAEDDKETGGHAAVAGGRWS